MKAFTGFAIGILAVLGAVAAVFIYLKKKTEKEIEDDEFDEIMDSDADFDDDFFEDEDDAELGKESAGKEPSKDAEEE